VSLYGKVPALEHAGRRIVESAVINEYLDEVFPAAPLVPREPLGRALGRIWIDFANTRLAPAFARVLRAPTSGERENGRKELSDALSTIEHEALSSLSGSGPFWFGAQPSLVDLTFYPWFERLPALAELHGFSVSRELNRLSAWRGAVEQLPAVRAIANATEFYLERFRSYLAPQAATTSPAN